MGKIIKAEKRGGEWNQKSLKNIHPCFNLLFFIDSAVENLPQKNEGKAAVFVLAFGRFFARYLQFLSSKRCRQV